MRDACVYVIENGEAPGIYVGSTVNLERRWGTHRLYLRRGTHHNPRLQNAWNKYGEDAFRLKTVFIGTEQAAREVEQDMLNGGMWGDAGCYNAARDVVSPTKGRTLSFEHRARIGAANARALRGKRLSPEHRARLSESGKGKKAGQPLSLEHRAKLSAAKQGQKRRPFTEETLARMSAAQLKRYQDAREAVL